MLGVYVSNFPLELSVVSTRFPFGFAAWNLDPHATLLFRLCENNELAVDEEGLELPNMRAVQIEAARSLVDIARHAVWTGAETILGHQMSIQVRDGSGPVLQAKFTFELEKHRQ